MFTFPIKGLPYLTLVTGLCSQEYNMSKRLEHGYKSMFNDGRTISAVNPKTYSRRFQEFLENVFV